MELLLCISQTENRRPYRFAGGVQVYSFEEALYHCYHFWKQSVDDFLSAAFVAWVGDTLGLKLLAAHIKEIRELPGFSEQMLKFLGLVPYFNREELQKLQPQIAAYEERLEWENYKERADELVAAGEPDKAIPLYRRAIFYCPESAALYNNIGVAMLQISEPQEAIRYLKEARRLAPNVPQILLAYAEAHILAGATGATGDYAEAEEAIAKCAATGATGVNSADILYLKGELAFAKNQLAAAREYFEEAIAVTPHAQYIFRLADVYSQMRRFEKALEVLALCPPQTVGFNTKQAELFALSGNLTRAIRTLQAALEESPQPSAEKLTRLAKYYRLDYNLQGAEEAISRALCLDGGSRTQLENARIKKLMGHTKEYQQVLKNVLAELKGRLRDAYN